MRSAGRAKVWVGVALAASVAGCVGDNNNVTLGSLGAEPPLPAAGSAPAAAPVSMGPLLEGPMGAKLSEADKQSAFTAETQALASGQRTTWRGTRGLYGYVVPAAGDGDCRGFTHTMYFAGRPQTGSGTGCKAPDGTWRITG